MRSLKYVLIAVFAVLLLSAVPASHAQVSVGIDIGAAPACPYGYYGYAPYQCAPYGYYGPEWFGNGIFIGAGPWYHGYGYGYRGVYGYRGGYYGHPGYGYGHPGYVGRPVPYSGGYRGASTARGGFAGGSVHGNVSGGGGGFHGGGGGHGGGGHR